ncbi:hypothetical protein EJ08DRAFT_656408 [Tothia fuscella]|uniref:1-alkyl-2-acetylglycerophosphocholine esterase n=1 Tax=Tothia fuscella TaxID=1048955 RepID=A0A9P4NZJ9_9PEZI|nr:hypothetical protein EJ08DRAFT_656408 [Tothia fuscella]
MPSTSGKTTTRGDGRKSSLAEQANPLPNSKKPRSRPPESMRDKAWFFHGTLPKYSGPYIVGMMDIEVPVEKPRVFSDITRHKHHILNLETVLMAVYYPSEFGSGAGNDPSGHKNWSRETWLPRPRGKLAKGYGGFAGFGSLAIPFFGRTTMLTKIPAFRNAEPARHWPPPTNSYEHGFSVKNEEGPPPDGESAQPCFPLLIFSHGLGGTRMTYSSLCGEFASYGFVVCALEHRDGSGPRTYVNHVKGTQGNTDHTGCNSNIDHTDEQRKKGYDRVDYTFPRGNPKDTSPNSEKGVDQELRRAQLEMRLAEIEEAYKVLKTISEGNGAQIGQKNLRRKGFKASSSRGLEGINWDLWKDTFYLDEVTMLGHSFGAATTIEVLRNAERFKFVGQGPNEEYHQISNPLLGINSEAFMYWQTNFDTVRSLVEEAKSEEESHGAPSWLLTMTANPQRAIDLNIGASLEFLKAVMKGRSAIITRTMRDEGILQIPTLEKVLTERRPASKWTAVRLKILHQFRQRVVPKLERKLRRKTAAFEPSDEIWMHVNSSSEELSDWEKEKAARRLGKKADEELRLCANK